MAYNDELGLVLDRLSRDDLVDFAMHILKEKERNIHACANQSELRNLCSKKLRRAGGHAVPNVWRNDHDLPYLEICRTVAKKLRIKFPKTDDVLILERKIIDQQTRKFWDKITDTQQQDLTDVIKAELLRKGGGKLANNLNKNMLNSIIKKGVTSGTISSLLGVGSITNTVGSVLGYNIVQKILLQTIYRYFGLWVAGKAILGIGLGAVAINVARFAGPIGLAISTAYTANHFAGPTYGKTIPAVQYIALKRLEIFNVE